MAIKVKTPRPGKYTVGEASFEHPRCPEVVRGQPHILALPLEINHAGVISEKVAPRSTNCSSGNQKEIEKVFVQLPW